MMLDKLSDCSKFEGLLDSFLDEELSNEENTLVALHLADCRDCQRRLEETKLLVGKLKQLPRLSLPQALNCDWDRLVARQAEKKSPVALFMRPNSGFWPAAALAASVVLFLLVQRVLVHFSDATFGTNQAKIVALFQNKASNLSTAQSSAQAIGEEESNEHLTGSFEDLLAADPAESSSFSEEVGISTDEDGLYALKL